MKRKAKPTPKGPPHKKSSEADELLTAQASDLPAGLSQPALRALIGADCLHLEKVATYRETQLKRLHGVGPSAIELLREALAAKGLSFAAEAESEDVL